MKQGKDGVTRGQGDSNGDESDSPGLNRNDLNGSSDVLSELRRQTIALEKLVELIRAYSQIEERTRPAAKEKRVRRSELEITRIVADAIKMVEQTGWSDSRIAREIGVERRVFCSRKPYLEARERADEYFARRDPETGLE